MEFKKLEVRRNGNFIQRILQSKKTTFIAIGVGAVIGFSYYYFTRGQRLDEIPFGEAFKSTFVGAFIGYFITNSPCARGKC